ncbi:MAG: YdhR family protein [Colwellia sp.]|nr:YdhR family protein [Colwellia sp.]
MKAFVYTELQISVPFNDAPWKEVNTSLLRQPGLINKTWLSGTTNNSLGGFYAFESIEDAQNFVTGYFPSEAKKFGVAQTTRIFNAEIVEEASRVMNSVHFGAELKQKPGAFVYTEVQVNVPFELAPWKEINPGLKAQKGFLAKTWLSGLHNNTLGGLYAFDTIENAKEFATNAFPKEAAGLNAAFYTRVFDASIVEAASLELSSPFFA